MHKAAVQHHLHTFRVSAAAFVRRLANSPSVLQSSHKDPEAHLVRLSEPVVYFVKLDCTSSVLVLLSPHCPIGSLLSL